MINIHRYDNGQYFPHTGHATCEGTGEGKGFNINIPFSGSTQAEYGDPEYLAAFRSAFALWNNLDNIAHDGTKQGISCLLLSLVL